MERIEITATDGTALVGETAGSGPPVVLLHGAGQTRWSWRRTADALVATGYRAIVFDARGHGDTDWSRSGYGIGLFADDLAAIVDRVGGAPALIGASMGGLTAMYALGRDRPVSASALVLVDIALRVNDEGREQIAAFMLGHSDGFASVEEAADAVSAYLTHRPRPADPSGLRKNLRLRDGRYHWHWDPSLIRGDGWPKVGLEAAAARIGVPTLLIYGSASELVDAPAIEHMRGLMPAADVIRVEGAGHMVAGDANSPFTAAIMSFLQRRYPA